MPSMINLIPPPDRCCVVFSAVRSVTLRGRTGRTTIHSLLFRGGKTDNAGGGAGTGRTVGDYSPSAWTFGTIPSWNHTPPSQLLWHHKTSFVPSTASSHRRQDRKPSGGLEHS